MFDSFLKYVESFQALDSHEKERLKENCNLLHLKKNQDLQPIGYTCKTIYFVQKGIGRIYYFKDGIDITDSFAPENHMIVRVESLFTGQPSRKGIQMIEDAEIVSIDAAKLFALYDQFPLIERAFRKIFEASHVETVKRIESIQFHTAEERYDLMLREAPELLNRVPLKYIASYLGITQTSLSRIRAKN
jgi:CRP-like cAMP-binding protein